MGEEIGERAEGLKEERRQKRGQRGEERRAEVSVQGTCLACTKYG